MLVRDWSPSVLRTGVGSLPHIRDEETRPRKLVRGIEVLIATAETSGTGGICDKGKRGTCSSLDCKCDAYTAPELCMFAVRGSSGPLVQAP